ncbi:MAG: RDD family protein [Myxococcaceae bacterium]
MSTWDVRPEGPRLQLVPSQGSPESPYPRCSRVLRVLARAADVGLAYALALATGRAGLVVALLYLLFADGLFHGQSAGKRIFGVRAVFLPLRAGARFRDSTLRNAPLALVVLLRMMPEPLGLKAFLGGLVVIGGVESWKSLWDPLGRRFGDVWAQTQVVDGKVVSGTAEEAAPSSVAIGPGRGMSRTRDGRAARFKRRQPACASR